jgi:hypothetical protein
MSYIDGNEHTVILYISLCSGRFHSDSQYVNDFSIKIINSVVILFTNNCVVCRFDLNALGNELNFF